MNNYDPITLEIIQNSLRSISDEMFSVIKKTAMSPIIYEVLDMATGIVTSEAEMASSGSGIPSFAGALDKSVSKVIQLHGEENIKDGDIFATNDPFYGGVTHLNDMVLMKPVFYQGVIISWVANIAHWSDISGKSPGSLSADAIEIFQEGLRVPAIRIFEKNKPIWDVINILICNSRMPEFLKGDMWAQVAALRLGSNRLIDLIDKYSLDLYLYAVNDYLNMGEKLMRKEIKNLPDGKYTLEEKQDDGTSLAVSIEIDKDEVTVDLTSAPNQTQGPANLSRDGSVLGCQMLLMALIGDKQLINGGCFRPINVKTKEGTIYHAKEPAACGIYFETKIRLNDLLWRCLAEYITEKLPSGNFSSICATIIGSIDAKTGQRYSIIEPQIGGWGAGDGFDGANAMFSSVHGETFNCPAEVAEARYGVTVGQMALNDEDGGAGQYRGGKGIVVDYIVRNDNTFLTCAYTRSIVPPWGLKGGMDGSTNRIEVIRATGQIEHYSISTEIPLSKGDIIRIITANGGGYGDPILRDPNAILRDLKNGYISKEYAESIYHYHE